ncbi:LysE family translocator [Methylophaga sp. OBS1]|uniref:LysE family translocator n=1 Tax=Methylophaga sp. OBS1 TaxID=2991933 RepID=UPI00225043A2|nr:LysE family translocator [Methylophaga sp. OBS1]MCX4193007.1 LysE family translocator [Methylophaga sp. OBS1]
MGFETLMGFFITSVLLALSPGPDNLFVMTHSLTHGKQAGVAVVLGLCTGLLVHTAIVALGIAAILQSSVWALTVLKTVGAMYLLYLAWQALTAETLALDQFQAHRYRFLWSYRRGIIMNITNPKVSLFFLAFLPQFLPAESRSVTQEIVLLGSLFILATLLVFGAMAVMAGSLETLFRRSPAIQRRLNKLAAVVFVALALHLLLASFV